MFSKKKWAPAELQRLKKLVEKYGVDEVIRLSKEFSVQTRNRESSIGSRKRAASTGSKKRKSVSAIDDDAKTLDPPKARVRPPKMQRSHSYGAPTSPKAASKKTKVSSKRDLGRPSSIPHRSKRSGLSRSQFLLGDFIQIEGSSRKWVNGLYGEINGPFNVRKDRWPVALNDINGKERKLTMKTENLKVVDEFGRGDFEDGDLVQVFGLKDADYNGLVGRIHGAFKKGKWPVLLKHGIFKHCVVEDQSEEIMELQQQHLRSVENEEGLHPVANSFCSYAGLQSACMTADNKCLALEKSDYSVHEWDIATGEYNRIINFSTDLSPKNIRLSPDGKLLVALGDEVQIYRLESNELICTIQRVKTQMGLFQSFDVSWDCATLALGFGGSTQDFEIKLFDLSTAEQVECFEGLRMPVKCLKISKGGEYLFSAHQDTIDYGVKPSLCQIRKTEIKTGEIVNNIAHEAEIHFICITSDERYVFIGDATSTIKVFNFDTMERVQEIKTKNQQVTCGIISRGDDYLITGGKGSSKRDTYFINIWNVDTGDSEFALMFRNKKNHDWIEQVGLSDDQRYVFYLRGSHCKVGMINCEKFLEF